MTKTAFVTGWKCKLLQLLWCIQIWLPVGEKGGALFTLEPIQIVNM